MRPERMCMVCRTRAEKKTLIRVVRTPQGEILPDEAGVLPGRGAYLCRSKACLTQARKRRALERAFSQPVDGACYAALERLAEEEE